MSPTGAVRYFTPLDLEIIILTYPLMMAPFALSVMPLLSVLMLSRSIMPLCHLELKVGLRVTLV